MHFHQTLCALILWRSCLGLLMGKFRQFFTELSACDRSIFSFWDDSFSKNQWIFTKLGVCIDIVQICSGIVDRQVSSFFDSYLPGTCRYFHFRTITLVNFNGFSLNFVCALTLWTSALGLLMVEFLLFLKALFARNTSVFHFQDNNLSISQWIFTTFDVCIDIVEICFGIAHQQNFCQFLTELTAHNTIMAGYYCSTFYFYFGKKKQQL